MAAVLDEVLAVVLGEALEHVEGADPGASAAVAAAAMASAAK